MAELINSYTRGQDDYPNNTTGAYDMLVNYHSPTLHPRTQVQDYGLAFAQDSEFVDVETPVVAVVVPVPVAAAARPMRRPLLVVTIIPILMNTLSNCTQLALFMIVVRPNASFNFYNPQSVATHQQLLIR